MYLGHLHKFWDAINEHGRKHGNDAEHDMVLYHEQQLYDWLVEYSESLDKADTETIDRICSYMLHYIRAVNEYTGLKIDESYVMFELIDDWLHPYAA